MSTHLYCSGFQLLGCCLILDLGFLENSCESCTRILNCEGSSRHLGPWSCLLFGS